MSERELKPCPFCGGEPELDREAMWVVCICGAENWADQWNRRAPSPDSGSTQSEPAA